MKPDPRFLNQPSKFWAGVRAVGEAVGYTRTLEGYVSIPKYLQGPKVQRHRNNELKVPTQKDVRDALVKLGLQTAYLFPTSDSATADGLLVLEYLAFRAKVLNGFVPGHLMDAPEARRLFRSKLSRRKSWKCPLPHNNQGKAAGSKKFLTCLVNMIICEHAAEFCCNFDPQSLVRITKDGHPERTLARRLDGAFPSPIDPIAIWEIKEYYYTTTFGSAVSRGVFETQLDGMELRDVDPKVWHYLFVDSHYCWWAAGGKPYLCRLVDLLHQGYVDEILFGHEIVERLPELVAEWVSVARSRNLPTDRPAANPKPSA